MACRSCQRRNKTCDERRPRCSVCRASRLRCRYDHRPAVLLARREQRRRLEPAPVAGSPGIPPPYGSIGLFPRPEPLSIPDSNMGRPTAVPLVSGTTQSWGPLSNLLRQVSLFAKFLASWEDQFPELNEIEDVEQTASHFNYDEPGAMLPPPYNFSSGKYTEEEIRKGMGCVAWPSELTPNPLQPPKFEGLPIRLLTQYYSRVLDGQLTFKRPDWTFYTYFFHRFSADHRCLLSAIQAWASATLHSSGKRKALNDALQNYDDSLVIMDEKYGLTASSIDSPQERRDKTLHLIRNFAPEDKDAMFVAYFFLALVDLMAARSHHLRGILRFIASFLENPEFRASMTGVQARIACWFCVFDGKTSAFQPGGGAIFKAIGNENSLISAFHVSHTTLDEAYRTNRTEREQATVHHKFLLQDLMLRLSSLLYQITDTKHSATPPNPDRVQAIRTILDAHKKTLETQLSPLERDDKCRATFLIVSALYHSLEITFSRSLRPSDRRHAAHEHALRIVQLSGKLENVRSDGLASSSSVMQIWPLPLVMAVVEIEGSALRESASKLLAAFEPLAGEHYSWAKKFAERVCEQEDKAGRRVDWGVVMQELNDGMVI